MSASSPVVAIVEADDAPGAARVVLRVGDHAPTLAHAAELLAKHSRFIDEALALVRAGKARRVVVVDEETVALTPEAAE